MQKAPLVSVVTVTLNCAKLIQATIDSVAEQKYTRLEHIIVDGRSSDGTLTIIRQNESEILRWVSEPDHGIYDAMNKGLSLASPESQYINFLNAGDIFHDEQVINDVVLYGRDTEEHVYGNVQKEARSVIAPESLNRFVLSTDMVCHQAIFFNTPSHLRFFYDLDYEICADYKLFLKMLCSKEKFRKFDRTIVDFDNSGLSGKQRGILHREKQEIRKSFPRVRVYRVIKLSYRRLRNNLSK